MLLDVTFSFFFLCVCDVFLPFKKLYHRDPFLFFFSAELLG